MRTITILRVDQFRDRDYAIYYRDEYDVPRIEYRLDKNHEQHAINGFVRDRKLGNSDLYVFAPPEKRDVTLTIDGEVVYEGEL